MQSHNHFSLVKTNSFCLIVAKRDVNIAKIFLQDRMVLYFVVSSKGCVICRTLCRSCAGAVPELCRSCAGDVPELCRSCAGFVPELCRTLCRSCAGAVPELCRSCAGAVPELLRSCAGAMPDLTGYPNPSSNPNSHEFDSQAVRRSRVET